MRSEVRDGVYTGRLAGPFTYREGKAVAIRELAEREGIDLEASYAYSDSESDLPMLRAVGNPVAVNPDTELARIARAEGWRVMRFDKLGLRLKVLRRRRARSALAGGVGGYAAGARCARRRAAAAGGRDHASRPTPRALAEAVLRHNDNGGYTVPSRATYPHQWNWDSALAALGWAVLDPARAWTELDTLVGARDRAGHGAPHRLPQPSRRPPRQPPARPAHARRPHVRALPPGTALVGHAATPWTAGASRASPSRRSPRPARGCCSSRTPTSGAPARCWRRCCAWHRFLLDARDPHGLGEPTIVHPWETGRDNAVEWDGPLWRVMPEVHVVHRRDTHSVDAAERPTDEHYRRFLTLVRQGTRCGWDQRRLAAEGSFRVLDAGFSALLARAARDLAWLAEQLGEDGDRRAERGRLRARRRRAARARRLRRADPLGRPRRRLADARDQRRQRARAADPGV